MPFKSKAQRAFLYSQHPDIAKEFQDATPKGKKLPERVRPSTVASKSSRGRKGR
jgi:hypothetical protein